MNNSAILFFSALHYSIYGVLAYYVYRKYIKSFLVQERENELMIEVQLHQRIALLERSIANFKQHVDYIYMTLKKIMSQYDSARSLIHQDRAEKNKRNVHRDDYYDVQKRKSMHSYAVRLLSKDLESTIIKKVNHDVAEHFKEHGALYMRQSISRLKEDAQKDVSKRQEKSSL